MPTIMQMIAELLQCGVSQFLFMFVMTESTLEGRICSNFQFNRELDGEIKAARAGSC